MKIIISSLGAICLLILGCVNADLGQLMENKNEFTYESSFSDEDPYLPFIINQKSESELYQDSKWALKILEVLADDKHIDGKPSYMFLDDVNIDSKKIDSTLFVYKNRYDNMIFGDLSSNGEYSLVKCEIPVDVKLLEIKYRFVYFGGDKDSRLNRLKAFRIR